MFETNSFLKDLEGDNQDAFKHLGDLELDKPEQENSEEEIEEQRKNRRERRLEKQLQAERENAIALAERVKVLSEVGKFKEEVGDDYIKEVRAIFGDEKPENKAASDILEKTLRKIREDAVKEAEDRFSSRQVSESKAVQDEEKNLDAIMEDVEDEYGIDMSNEAVRRGFLNALEKASPKDKDGDIIEFADPDYVAEKFVERRKSNVRGKEIASRSMTPSGQSNSSGSLDKSLERQMMELDII